MVHNPFIEHTYVEPLPILLEITHIFIKMYNGVLVQCNGVFYNLDCSVTFSIKNL